MTSKAETVKDIAEHKIKEEKHSLEKEANKTLAKDSDAGILDRGEAAVKAAGHSIAEGSHAAAKETDEKKLRAINEAEALKAVAEHKALEEEHRIKREADLHTINDPSAPILDKVTAAADATVHYVAETYHSYAKGAQETRAENS